jgi:AbrB family looped-hinge helix DNA binding protein
VEAVIAVDERGQMVLPKGVRENMGIRPGDKLAVVTWKKEDDLCCISLVRVDWLSEMVKGILGPVMADVVEP